MKNHLIFFSLLLTSVPFVFSQKTATITGTLRDENKKPLEAAHVAIEATTTGTSTGKDGSFSLTVPADTMLRVGISFLGYESLSMTLKLRSGEIFRMDTSLAPATKKLTDVIIEDRELRTSTLRRIDPKVVKVIPTPSGNIEAILKTMPGVTSSSELSSQYSVRGGNYDENLIYVNDIEIYRPFLIRSGQQEGLSFINSDLVSSILFSAGGFDARYGDKMSSVLDIRYKKPQTFSGSADASMLGGSVHMEDVSKNYRFTHITGVRYKSNQYILNSLNTRGEYKPSFTDVQTYLTYDITENAEIAFLGNYSRSKFRFVPETRETRFGTVNQAYQLTVYFDGQEIDDFETSLGAFTLTHRYRKNLEMKWITSAFRSAESERYDILGQYWIHEIEKDMSKEKFGQPKYIMGVGTHLNHARNNLNALVYNLEHKATYSAKNSLTQWGIKLQSENIEDRLSEWIMIDSAGYALPHPADSPGYYYTSLQPQQEILMDELLKTGITLNSNRASCYLQKKWYFTDTSKFSITAGIRASWWEVNKQGTLSPRASFSYRPKWKNDFLFRLSGGYYHQPPFYREIRDMDGNIHFDVGAQQSIHGVAGMDYNFPAWNRSFKLVTEVYYKHLPNLIPYQIENVRIRYYSGINSRGYATGIDKLLRLVTKDFGINSRGYATGIDLRLNGEFVKGLESWASLSVMQTKEDIIGDYYYDYYNSDGEKIIRGYTYNNIPVDSIRHEPGYIPRPTDQRVTFGLFFQDYLPMLPDFKMHLSLLFGTGFPFGPPGNIKYKDTLRLPPYRRVDIGFSYLIMDETKKMAQKKFFSRFKSIWVSAEVFNLLGTNNTISYLWVRDVTGRRYAVPNYLTQRLLNVRMMVEF